MTFLGSCFRACGLIALAWIGVKLEHGPSLTFMIF